MSEKEKQILRDMGAYLMWIAKQEGISFHAAMYTISHDVGGIVNEERCFTPRTSGYEAMNEMLETKRLAMLKEKDEHKVKV